MESHSSEIRKYSFVNRFITEWNRLPEVAIGTSYGKTSIFKRGLAKWKPVRGSEDDKKVKGSEVTGSDL